MLTILFIIFVVAGFIFWFLATFPTPPAAYAERIARGCFLAASLIWAFQQVGSR